MKLLLFPNQLFEKKYLPKSVDIIFLVEDPVFFDSVNLNIISIN